MTLIDKGKVVTEINRVLDSYDPNEITSGRYALINLRDFLETLEEKHFVYVVTRCEEHSDYVEDVFLDKEKAEAYCKPFNEDEDSYHRDITKVKLVE